MRFTAHSIAAQVYAKAIHAKKSMREMMATMMVITAAPTNREITALINASYFKPACIAREAT